MPPAHSLFTAVPVWGPKRVRALGGCIRHASGYRDQCVYFSSRFAGRLELVAYADETPGSGRATGARGLTLTRSGDITILNGAKIGDFSRRQTSTRIPTPQTCIAQAAGVAFSPTVAHLDNRTAIKTTSQRLLDQSTRLLRLALNILIATLESREVVHRWVDLQTNITE